LLLALIIAGPIWHPLLPVSRLLHRQNPPPPLWQFRPGLRVAVEHGEIGNDDGHGQRDGQHPGQGAQRTHKHPSIYITQSFKKKSMDNSFFASKSS
jgi:hypothetical protein